MSSVAGPSKKRASSSASDTEQSGIISSISVNQQRDASQHVTSDLPSCPSVVPELSKLRTSSFDSDESSNDPEQAETLCTVLAQVHSHQSCVSLFESELYPKKRIALSTSGSISNASGEVTDTFARRGAGSVEDLFEGFRERKEYEASGKLIEELRARIDNQTEEIRLLQSEVHKLRALNMSLQEVLVQKGQDYTFAEIPGYPKTEWLLSVSQNAGDSDYLFIKELVFHLFPEGVGSATPTGRPSNNPKGRSNIQPGNSDDGTPPMQKLDPQKVQYMKGILILDTIHIAIHLLFIFNFYVQIDFMTGVGFYRSRLEWPWPNPKWSTNTSQMSLPTTHRSGASPRSSETEAYLN